MRTFGKTCLCARGSNCCVNNDIVTKCGNFFLSNYVVASCAMLACCKTCFCARGSYCFVNNDIVTESVNYFLSYLVVASGAMLACCETCFCARGSYCFVNYHIVTESSNLIADIRSAANGAGISCKASGCTSGSGYYCVVAVLDLRKLVICCVIASGAGFVSFPTNSGTCGSLCLVRDLIVSESVDGFCICIAAYGTSNCLHTCFGTSGFFSNCFLIGVRSCIYCVCCTAEFFAAYGTVNYFIVAACRAAGCRC